MLFHLSAKDISGSLKQKDYSEKYVLFNYMN